MTHSQLIAKTARQRLAAPARAEDGYFGWTDRFGIRPSFYRQGDAVNRERGPYFIANY